jgi:hypothetical protein
MDPQPNTAELHSSTTPDRREQRDTTVFALIQHPRYFFIDLIILFHYELNKYGHLITNNITVIKTIRQICTIFNLYIHINMYIYACIYVYIYAYICKYVYM